METGQRIRREKWEKKLTGREIQPIDDRLIESGQHSRNIEIFNQ
jgi:hypothetical protein